MTFAYDPLDRLETVADSQGSSNLYTYAFEYNAVGWLKKATTYLSGYQTSYVTLDYTYNDNGQRKTVSATIGEGQSALPDFLNTYDYDDLGRMIFVEQEQQSQNNPVTHKYVDFHYYADSRMKQIKRYQRRQAQNDNVHLEDDLLVATSGYTYDNASRLTAVAHSGGGSWVSGGSWGPEWVVWPSDRFVSAVYSCGYDRAGRVISSSTPDGTATYSYDAAHQLESATYSTGSPQEDASYDYDDNGNRESVIIGGTTDTYGTPGANNRLTFDGEYYYAYDDEGNRIERYQVSGGQHVQITIYGWDNRNRLVSVETKDSETGPITKEVQYTYDAFDRRIVKAVDPDGAGTSAALHVVEQYVYDGRNIALVFDSVGTVKRYLYGPGVDQVLACEAANGLVSWMLADNQGTVRDVVTVDHHTQQETSEVLVYIDGNWYYYHYANGPYIRHVGHTVYDAFGNIDPSASWGTQSRFAYTGQEWDADAGMYYYDARYYDAHAGVFASEDPIGFLAGDPNLSRYCVNSPTNFADPSGMAGSGAVQPRAGWTYAPVPFDKNRRPPAPTCTGPITCCAPSPRPPRPYEAPSIGADWRTPAQRREEYLMSRVRDRSLSHSERVAALNAIYDARWQEAPVSPGYRAATNFFRPQNYQPYLGGTSAFEQFLIGAALIRGGLGRGVGTMRLTPGGTAYFEPSEQVPGTQSWNTGVYPKAPGAGTWNTGVYPQVQAPSASRVAFPKNPGDLLPGIPRNAKGQIQPSEYLRIRPEQHALTAWRDVRAPPSRAALSCRNPHRPVQELEQSQQRDKSETTGIHAPSRNWFPSW